MKSNYLLCFKIQMNNKRLMVLIGVISVSITIGIAAIIFKTYEAKKMKISKEMALEIAQHDASQRYRDLSIYNIKVNSKEENWEIDYELKDSTLDGGGPHYIISGKDGRILYKKYEQ